MKKFFKCLALLSVFFTITVILSCEIGLGTAVDTEAPVLNVTSPDTDAIICDAFAIKGTWTDDGDIASVSVTIARTDETGSPLTHEATVTGSRDEGGWYTVFEPSSENIIDGSYEATISITDMGGHTVTKTKTFVIDNTSPLIVLQRPGTKLTEEADAYGQTFSLEGMYGDDNSVDHIDIEIYRDADFTDYITTITKSNVAASMNLNIAVFEEGEENSYSEIYGSTSGNGTVTRYCKITAYDKSKHYPLEEDTSSSLTDGNPTSVYYLYDDIYDAILDKYTVSVADLYKMQNGTYLISSENRSASTVNEVLSLLTPYEISESNFSLNPANNPYFFVNGKDQLTQSGQDFEGSDYNITNGSSVILEVATGLDGIPLRAATLRPYVIPCDASGNASVENTEANRIYLATAGTGSKSGTSYKFTVNLSSTTNYNEKYLTVGSTYIFGVEGTDSKGNAVIAKFDESGSSKPYGFKLASSGAAPGLTVTSPSSPTAYVKANGKQLIEGTVTCQEGTPTLTISTSDTTVYTKTFTSSEGQIINGLLYYSFSTEIDYNGVTENSQTQYTITASQEQLETSIYKTIIYDKDAPTVSIGSLLPTAEKYDASNEASPKLTGQYLNGTVTLKLSVIDDYDIVDTETENKKPYLEVLDADNSDAVISLKIADETENTERHYITSLINGAYTIDTTQIANRDSNGNYVSKNIKFKIYGCDRAGNDYTLISSEYTVDQSTDIPVVLPTNATSTSLLYASKDDRDSGTNGGKSSFPSGGSISLNVIDDDGIASCAISRASYASNETSSSIAASFIGEETTDGGSSTQMTVTYNLPSEAGYYWLKAVVTDTNGIVVTKGPFLVRVTTAAPSVLTVTAVTSDSDAAVGEYISNSATSTKTKWKNIVEIEASDSPFYLYRKEGSDFTTDDYPATKPETPVAGLNYTDAGGNVLSTLVAVSSEKEIEDIITGETSDKTYYYKVFDANWNPSSNSKSITCKFDNIAPSTLTITKPASSSGTAVSVSGDSETFTGTAYDAAAGSNQTKSKISTLNYAITASSAEPAASDWHAQDASEGKWNLGVTLNEGSGTNSITDTLVSLYEGHYYLHVKAEDAAGNKSNSVYREFFVDQSSPSIETKLDDADLSTSLKQVKTSAYSFKFKPSDTNALDTTEPYTITVTKDSVALTKVEAGAGNGYSVSSADSEGYYTVAIEGSVAGDGTYEYTITAKDVAGKTGSVSRTVQLDTTAPEVSIITPDVSDGSYQNSTKVTVKGSASDDSGTSGVYYQLSTSETAPAVPTSGNPTEAATWTGNGWTAATGSTSWTTDLDLTGIEGSVKYLYYVAVDKNGLVSAVSRGYIRVDTANPTSTTVTDTLITNSNITLTGTAWDLNGLKSISVSDGTNTYSTDDTDSTVSVTGGTLATAISDSSKVTWTKTFAVGTSGLADGTYTFTITVKDKADKTTIKTREITIDTVNPVLESTAVSVTNGTSDYKDIDSVRWYKTRTIKVSASPSDNINGSGVDSISYSTVAYDSTNPNANRNWTDLTFDSTNSVYKGSVSFDSDGLDTVYFRVKDKAGNTIGENDNLYYRSYYIDTESPDTAEVIKVGDKTSDFATVYVNGTDDKDLYISAADKSVANASSGIGSVKLYKVGTNAQSALTSDDGELQTTGDYAGLWKITIKAKDYSTGKVVVEITDKVGNTSYKFDAFQMQLDNTYPSATINAVTDALTTTDTVIDVNKTFTLSGTASDDRSLSSVKLQYKKSSDTTWLDYPVALTGTTSWSVSIDTVNAVQSDGTKVFDDDPTSYDFRISASDDSGNTGNSGEERDTTGSNAYSDSNVLTLYVNQDSDRPLITFTNLTINGMSASAPVWLKNSTTLLGIISDDDGVTSLSYKTDLSAANWTPVTVNNGAWSITLREGASTLYFQVVDKASTTEFTSEVSATATSVLTTPKLSDGTNSIVSGIPVYMKVDKTSPVYENLRFSYWDGTAYTAYSESLATVGGKRTKFRLNFTAGDENGIASVSLTVGENTTTVSTPDSTESSKRTNDKYYSTWTIPDVSVENLDSQSLKATLTITDTAGLEKTDLIDVVVDNTPSTATVSYPLSSATVSGDVSSYGDLTEIATLYYAVSPSSTNPDVLNGAKITSWLNGDSDSQDEDADGEKYSVDSEDWIQVTDASTKWTINFNNFTGSGTCAKSLNKYIIDYKIANKDSTDEAVDSIVSSFDDVVILYLHLKTIDAVGNVNHASYPIYIDPQGDRPSISFSYPLENDGTMGGKVSIYGTASDTEGTNKGVDSVWVQIKSTTHRAAEDTTTYGTSPTYDSATDSISMTLTKEDLDYMAANGYSVYKRSDYVVGGTNTAWVSGQSLGTGESADDYAALATLNGASWNITINKVVQTITTTYTDETGEEQTDTRNLFEFDPPYGVNNNPIAIRVYARDGDGKFSQKAERYVSFDADNPVISDLVLVQSSDAKLTTDSTAEKTYTKDMFVKDSWYLTGTVTDKQGLKELIVNNVTLISNCEKIATYADQVSIEDAEGGGKTVKFKYPLSTSSGVGSLSFKVEATDNAEGTTHTGSEDLVINYDNTKPELAPHTSSAFSIGEEIYQNNSWYSFGSSVYEETSASGAKQAGFAYTAFYFKRGSNIYDILKAKTENKIELGATVPSLGSETSTAENTIVKDSNLYWYRKSITANSISGNSFGVSDTTGIRTNALMKIGGALYLITGVEGTTVTVDTALSSENISLAYVAIAGIVDNTKVESAPSSGDIQDDGYYESPTRDDGDRMIESVDNTGTTWVWNANVCSKNIADGPVELCYVVFDKAGNYKEDSVSGKIINNRPRIAGAVIKTDYNGDGDVTDDGETINNYAASRSYSDYYTGTTTSGAYIYNPDSKVVNTNAKNPLPTSETYGSADAPIAALRGYTLIQPEIVGGNDSIYYSYKVTNGSTVKEGENETAFISAGSTDYTAVTGNINIQLGDLLSFGDTTNATTGIPFEFTFWDETEGTTKFSDSQNASLTMYFAIQAASVGTPTASIKPFHWTSLTDNSIYDSSEVTSFKNLKGHIELEGDLPSPTFASTKTELYDLDPKVSGKITIEGVASDTKLLAKLSASIFGTSYDVAEYSSTSGLLESKYAKADFADNGFWFELVKGSQTINADGHSVSWKLHIDTEVILSSKTGTEKEVTMTATNFGIPSATTDNTNGTLTSIDGTTKYLATLSYTDPASSTPGETQTNSTTNTGYYKMDVVPYITKVYTNLAKNKSSNWSVYNRTALGHYPVQSVVSNIDSSIELKTSTSEDVILYGFNLNDNSAKITSGSNTFTVGNETALLSITNNTAGQLTFNVAKLATGELNLTVGGLPVLNNINNNDAKGTASANGSAYVNCYNRQANGDTNNILTDNVYFDVWEFNDRAATPINGLATGINMEVNQVTGMLNYAFANGGLFYSMGGNSDKTTAYSKDNSYSSIYWAGDWDTFAGPCVGFHVDELGYTYSLDSGGDTNGSGSVDKWVLYSSRWGLGALGTGGTLGGTNSLRLEEIALKTGDGTFAYSLMKYRFLSPEFASTTVSGTSTTNLYLVYYDALTNQIRFRAGTFNTTAEQTSGGFQDEYTSGTPSYYSTSNCQVIANGESDPFKTGANDTDTVTIPQITGRGAGQYVDVAVVKNAGKDVVCVVWYDAISNSCKYSYITDPIANWDTLKGNATALNWSTPQTIFTEGGEYCHIVSDKNNHLHIAAYAGNSDVMYAYLDTYSSTASTATVDNSNSVGEHLTLDVGVNSKGHSIPYIGYYTGAIKKPKYAYLVDPTVEDPTANFTQVADGADTDELYTGAWEVVTVPTPSIMTTNREDKVNVGLWKSSGVITNSTRGTCSKANTINDYASTNWSKTWGNGTANGVLGYQVTTGTGTGLETAQMR